MLFRSLGWGDDCRRQTQDAKLGDIDACVVQNFDNPGLPKKGSRFTSRRQRLLGSDSLVDQGVDQGRRQAGPPLARLRSEEHTSELQSQSNLVCRLLLEKKKISPLPGLWTLDSCFELLLITSWPTCTVVSMTTR